MDWRYSYYGFPVCTCPCVQGSLGERNSVFLFWPQTVCFHYRLCVAVHRSPALCTSASAWALGPCLWTGCTVMVLGGLLVSHVPCSPVRSQWGALWTRNGYSCMRAGMVVRAVCLVTALLGTLPLVAPFPTLALKRTLSLPLPVGGAMGGAHAVLRCALDHYA